MQPTRASEGAPESCLDGPGLWYGNNGLPSAYEDLRGTFRLRANAVVEPLTSFLITTREHTRNRIVQIAVFTLECVFPTDAQTLSLTASNISQGLFLLTPSRSRKTTKPPRAHSVRCPPTRG